MKKITQTIRRNSLCVGNNSKSYDEKHQSMPIVMHPISQVMKRRIPSGALRQELRVLGTAPKMDIDAFYRRVVFARQLAGVA